ncbi:MAG: hypothetical protein CL920_28370 [Deltaproteobacteria bacterium]|nr:hypothetical protein [Deltaproteobacteria bacterium]
MNVRPAPPVVQLRWRGERYKTPSDGLRPPAPPTRFSLRSYHKGSDESPSQSDLSLVQFPLRDLRSAPVSKGSDAHQTIYRDTNEKSVYIGWFVPPFERVERRDEPEAQGGEFVEAYVAKRTEQTSS